MHTGAAGTALASLLVLLAIIPPSRGVDRSHATPAVPGALEPRAAPAAAAGGGGGTRFAAAGDMHDAGAATAALAAASGTHAANTDTGAAAHVSTDESAAQTVSKGTLPEWLKKPPYWLPTPPEWGPPPTHLYTSWYQPQTVPQPVFRPSPFAQVSSAYHAGGAPYAPSLPYAPPQGYFGGGWVGSVPQPIVMLELGGEGDEVAVGDAAAGSARAMDDTQRQQQQLRTAAVPAHSHLHHTTVPVFEGSALLQGLPLDRLRTAMALQLRLRAAEAGSGSSEGTQAAENGYDAGAAESGNDAGAAESAEDPHHMTHAAAARSDTPAVRLER